MREVKQLNTRLTQLFHIYCNNCSKAVDTTVTTAPEQSCQQALSQSFQRNVSYQIISKFVYSEL